MIDAADEAFLPGDVTLNGDWLRDEVLQQSYPINATAALFLAGLGERRQIGALATTVSETIGVPCELLEPDLLSFVARLNGTHLINVRPHGLSGRFRRARYVGLHLLLVRTIPPLFVTRHAISNSSCLAVLATTSSTLMREVLPVWMLPALCMLALGLVFRAPILLLAALAIVPAFACLVVHEIGHAVAVRVARGRSYLITAGCQAGIVHSVPEPPLFVHASGGLLAGAVGILIVLAAHITGNAVLAAIQDGKSTFGRLAVDTAMGERVQHIVDRLATVADALAGTDGTVGMLLNDRGTARDVRAVVADLALMVADTRAGKGAIGRLLTDAQLADDLGAAVADLARLLQKANDPTAGVVGALTSDPELARDVKVTVANLRTMTERLMGTDTLLGILISDKDVGIRFRRIVTQVSRALEDAREAAPIANFVQVLIGVF